ncbi:hypothetical protein OIE82_27085 [Streptomyces althioticus]|uniref:Minor tail protein n=1 Tax=Streptomyces althioticus TaxID=83380 RepID=A0ABZ1YB47_9ACTN
MAELSYPFNEDSAGGGSALISEAQWQTMSKLWASDRIDFRLNSAAYATTEMPFHTAIVGSNLVVQPGSAWVGGFYYKLDAPLTIPAPTNSGAQPRRDVVVVRLNMATHSANIAIKEGQPNANPSDPIPSRIQGGIWEMPLYAIDLAANNGSRTLSDRRRFDGSSTVYVPWNASPVASTLPYGQFVIDMDSNTTDTPNEWVRTRDGSAVTRYLGKRREYTPTLLGATSQPAASYRNGWYRYIAPGTVQFDIKIQYTGTGTIRAQNGVAALGFTLPVACSKVTPVIFNGQLANPEQRSGMPNLVGMQGRTTANTQNVLCSHQSISSLIAGFDGWATFPGKSTLFMSGVYETNDFD